MIINESNDTEYSIMKKTYDNYKEFKNRNYGDYKDFIDKLNGSGVAYDVYVHKTDKGCTVFFDADDNGNLKSNKSKIISKKSNKYVIYAKDTYDMNHRALFRKHRGPAVYCYESDAEVFDESDLKRYTSDGGEYIWIAKEVRR